MAEISNGKWFDTRTNTVVDSAPEEGVQIVAPGQEMTAALEADVKRYEEQGDGNKPAPNPAVDTAQDESKTVTTADADPQPEKTTKTSAKK